MLYEYDFLYILLEITNHTGKIYFKLNYVCL